ncbi:MAG TPA: cytochrome c biogenesis protein CcdA, partial [Vulgatibacter sp.]
MTSSISLGAAFAAGALSFLSPCVFPLVPGYISFLTGTAAGEAQKPARIVVSRAGAFALGFG